MKLKHWPLIILALAIIGCGKNNQVNTSATNQARDVLSPSTSTISTQNLNQIYGQFPCQEGVRLQEAVFHTAQFQFVGSTLNGNFTQGKINGTNYDRFIGLSKFNDIFVLEKVSNGAQVTGYNAIISYCQYSALIRQDSRFQSLQFSNGITLAENLNCDFGSVVATNSVMYPIDYPAFPEIKTTFTLSSLNSCPF
ncbi:MAG: hypothetical protein CME61_03350 [Halobacteriovoraceae bacterium]|nr:hypothetical protein [Halobacteriovoraceae bacterium]